MLKISGKWYMAYGEPYVGVINVPMIQVVSHVSGEAFTTEFGNFVEWGFICRYPNFVFIYIY